MAKKEKPKKKSGQPQADRTTFNIQGDIHANRDVILGEQINTIYQQVSTTKIESRSEFIHVLAALQTQVALLKQQPELKSVQIRNLESAEQNLDKAVGEAQKEKPDGNAIHKTLKEAKETFELLAGGMAAAASAGAILGNLIAMALKLFGG
jgi:hypothetical protein